MDEISSNYNNRDVNKFISIDIKIIIIIVYYFSM